MSSTVPIFQSAIPEPPAREVAPSNICFVVLTLERSKEDKPPPVYRAALLNICFIFTTLPEFENSKTPSKPVASWTAVASFKQEEIRLVPCEYSKSHKN